MIELDYGVIGPKPLLDVFAGQQLTIALQQHAEDLERLLLQACDPLALAQFTRAQVYFESSKAHAVWQRVSHG